MSMYRTLKVVPRIPEGDEDLATYAQAMHDAFVGNADFPSLSFPLPDFELAITEYRVAQANVRITPGGAKLRDAKGARLRQIVWHYREDVQRVVEVRPSRLEAAATAQRVGMDLRKPNKPSRATVRARCTARSGCVEVDAKSVGRGAVYFWQYSLDQETWTSVPESFRAKVVISGLTRGQCYYFRFRAHTRQGAVGFCEPVSLLVT